MPAGTLTAKYESEHRRAIDIIKGERQKELDKLKSEAAASILAQQALTQKLDKVKQLIQLTELRVWMLMVKP